MALLIKADGTEATVQPHNGTKFTLDELQAYVGGYIELLTAADGRWMWVNEDAIRRCLPRNETASHLLHPKYGVLYVLGDVLITKNESEVE